MSDLLPSFPFGWALNKFSQPHWRKDPEPPQPEGPLLEERPQPMSDIFWEGAQAGSLGGPVGGAGTRALSSYLYEPPLQEALRFPHITSPYGGWTPEEQALSDDLFDLGQRPELRDYRHELMDPVVVERHLSPKALAGIPEAELSDYLEGDDLSELTERRIRPHVVEVDYMPKMRAVLEENPMISYSVGGQSGIAPAQDVFDAKNNADLRGLFAHGIRDTGPAAAEKSILEDLAWDRAKSGDLTRRARLARGLKSLLGPANLLMDATLGAGVGGLSSAAGYKAGQPDIQHKFTPPPSVLKELQGPDAYTGKVPTGPYTESQVRRATTRAAVREQDPNFFTRMELIDRIDETNRRFGEGTVPHDATLEELEMMFPDVMRDWVWEE